MAKKTTTAKKDRRVTKPASPTPHAVTTKTAKMDVDDASLKKAGETVKH